MQDEHDFAKVIRRMEKIEGAMKGGTLNEPYVSIGFYVILGQRFATTTAILEMLLDERSKAMYGREIAQELAKRLGKQDSEFTRGSTYQRRVADVIDALTDVGILVTVKEDEFRRKASARAVHYRINPERLRDIERFVSQLGNPYGALSSDTTAAILPTKQGRLSSMLKDEFDRKLGRVVLPSGESEFFRASELIESLTEPDVNVPFYEALEVLESLENHLRPGMKTAEIQKLVYNELRIRAPDLARRYNREYPEEVRIIMTDGSSIPLGPGKINEFIKNKLGSYRIPIRERESITENVLNLFKSYPVHQRTESKLIEVTGTVIDVIFDLPKEDIQTLARRRIRDAMAVGTQVEGFFKAKAFKAAEAQRESVSRDMVPTLLLILGYVPFRDFESNLILLFGSAGEPRTEGLLSHRTKEIAKTFGVRQEWLDSIYNLRSLRELQRSGSYQKVLSVDYKRLVQTIQQMLDSEAFGTERVQRIFRAEE